MKTIFENFDEVQKLVDKIAEFDFFSALPIICMMIDTVSAKSGESAPEIAKTICELVGQVNNELGAYKIA